MLKRACWTRSPIGAPSWTTEHAWPAGRTAGDPLVVAVTTGEQIDTEHVRCADLLLVPAVVIADIDTPPAAATTPIGLPQDLYRHLEPTTAATAAPPA